jgi:hypothetical protein
VTCLFFYTYVGRVFLLHLHYIVTCLFFCTYVTRVFLWHLYYTMPFFYTYTAHFCTTTYGYFAVVHLHNDTQMYLSSTRTSHMHTHLDNDIQIFRCCIPPYDTCLSFTHTLNMYTHLHNDTDISLRYATLCGCWNKTSVSVSVSVNLCLKKNNKNSTRFVVHTIL